MAQYLTNELQPIAPLHTFSEFFNKVGNDCCASFLKCALQYIRCHSTFNLIHVQCIQCVLDHFTITDKFCQVDTLIGCFSPSSHYLNDSSNHSIVLNSSLDIKSEIQ
eukprot:935444_1